MTRIRDYIHLLNIFLIFAVMAAIGYLNITYALLMIAGMAIGVFSLLALQKAGFLHVKQS